MSFGSILLLAVGLAMDATAVAAARGMAVSRVRLKFVVLVALFFGGSQALMPVIGYVLGARLGPLVQRWDRWIAFALLAAIGGKMIWEAREPKEADQKDDALFALKPMLVLAVATSIDALAVGVTLPMVKAPLLVSVVTIGVVTAALSVVGLFAGRKFGAVLGQRVEIAGGVLLIGLGLKILLEHASG